MNSIDTQAPEEHHRNLAGADAVERLRTTVKKSATCFFCTAVSTGESGAARPMSVLSVDDDGTLWFLSAADSHKNLELGSESAVRLFFQASEHAGFLTLTGRARVSRDQARIEALWEPTFKVWFTEGETDPRITVIALKPLGGYYWDNQHGSAVAGVKMLVGAAIGRTLDDSIEGTLTF